MKPAPFDYYSPASIDEALDLLAELGYEVKVLAGGQSLIPAMNFRMAIPPALLDLTRIDDLVYIRPTDDGGLQIGAMTTDTAVERDPMVKERFPLIIEAMPTIAHPQIRNRGTFGGAIAHADPTGQLPAVCLALGASVRILSKNGERTLPLDEFFLGPFTTALEPEELLAEVILPPTPPRTGTSYDQMARQAGAQALVGIASVITLDEDGRVAAARIGMLSVGETPMLAVEAASQLIGNQPTAEIIAQAAETAATVDIVEPPSDIHSSPDYRRHLVKVLVNRSLTRAVERARA
ncbi:MAG TPA: xanthine dehydrogenase family protein subunit M [Anaerolineaceae bacterium]|nr:xanthine dehydrogenase family protein subunit M [Anaerolineaceae bacterium]